MTSDKWIKEKVCTKCNQPRPITDFWKKQNRPTGTQSVCRYCHRIYDRRRRSKNPEHIRAMKIENSKRMREKYPEKAMARSQLSSAIKMGNVKKLPCERCGDKKVEGHHPDYTKPLDVIWLCTLHHHEHHRLLSLKAKKI